MADLWNEFSSDVRLSSSGDLLLVEGPEETRHRILKRLLTNPNDYLWHLDYGAGLPSQIGQTTQAATIEGIVRRQMLMEPAVSASPPPTISAQAILGGVAVQITYRDRNTGTTQALGFSIER